MVNTFSVRETGVSGTARALFLCEPCHEAGEMEEPFAAPIKSKVCPVCGKKRRLIRVWTGHAPGVLTGLVKRTEALVGPGMDYQRGQKDLARQRNREAPMLAVPVHRIGETLQSYGAGQIALPMPTAGALTGVRMRDAAPELRGGKPITVIAGRDDRQGPGAS